MKRIFLCLFSCLLLLSACTFKEIKLIAIENVVIQNSDPRNVDMIIHATLANPNAFRVTIDHCEMDLYLNKTKMGRVTLQKSVTLARSSEKSYPLQVNVQSENVLGGVIQGGMFALLKGKAPIRITGTIAGRTFFFSKKFPIEYAADIPITTGHSGTFEK